MRVALSLLCLGFGSLLAAWVLPMLNNNLPQWLQIALLIAGVLLIMIGSALGMGQTHSKGAITVKMRDGNRIGQIGNRIER